MTRVTQKIENVLNELVDLAKGNFQIGYRRGLYLAACDKIWEGEMNRRSSSDFKHSLEEIFATSCLLGWKIQLLFFSRSSM